MRRASFINQAGSLFKNDPARQSECFHLNSCNSDAILTECTTDCVLIKWCRIAYRATNETAHLMQSTPKSTYSFEIAIPVDILILQQCWSDITPNIAMILLIYCKWNTWRCQFAISVWHQDLDIGPIRLLMWSWYRQDNGRYPAGRNPPGSCTTSVSATIMPRLYCGNWKLKLQVRFFSVAATKNLQNIFKQRYFT